MLAAAAHHRTCPEENTSFQQLHIKLISRAAARRMAFKKSLLIPTNIKLELFLELRPRRIFFAALGLCEG